MAEWESNESSTGCFLCGSSWGTFSNIRYAIGSRYSRHHSYIRTILINLCRHHCRRCGKLVCEACSANRVAPELILKDEKMKGD